MFHVADDVLPLLLKVEYGHPLDFGTRFARNSGRIKAESRMVKFGTKLLEHVAQHDGGVTGETGFDLLYAFFELNTLIGCPLILVSQLITVAFIERLL